MAANAGLLFVLALAAFSRPTDRLFTGFDGLGSKIFAQQLFRWQTLNLVLSGNPFEGLGGLYFINAHLVPTLAIVGFLPGSFGVTLAYAFAAIELFLATFLLG